MADSRYVLMHKNTPVADLQLDTDTGVIRSVGHVYNALHVPVGIPVKKGVIDRSAPQYMVDRPGHSSQP